MQELPPVPFELHHEINHDLSIVDAEALEEHERNSSFDLEVREPHSQITRVIDGHAVRGCANRKSALPLPGHPLLNLCDIPHITTFLIADLLTPRLNRLFPILWLVATPDSSHIAPLHENLVRGRTPIITENPGLHLVWYYDRICVKPLPEYLLNHAFWRLYLSDPGLRSAALGYVRSWAYLVRYQSDFQIAQERQLIPSSVTSFEDLLLFLEPFKEDIDDESVSLRYRYGDLRLSRLNLWSKIYLQQMFYHRIDGKHSAYFARFVPVFLFIFGTVSVGLGSMQVVVSVGDSNTIEEVAKWYSVACLLIVAATLVFFPAMQCLLLAREFVFVVKMYFSGTWERPKKGRDRVIEKAA